MGKLTDEGHVARTWVETNYPAARGDEKARLILAYGAGLDRGLAESEELIQEALAELRRGGA